MYGRAPCTVNPPWTARSELDLPGQYDRPRPAVRRPAGCLTIADCKNNTAPRSEYESPAERSICSELLGAPDDCRPEPKYPQDGRSQCAASAQLRPVPMDTSSGMLSSNARHICPRTSSRSSSSSPGGQAALADLPVHGEHGHLDDVGRRALDRRVQRHPLGHFPALAVVGGEVG